METIKLALALTIAVVMAFITPWAWHRAQTLETTHTIIMFFIDCWGLAFWSALTFRIAVRIYRQSGGDDKQEG